MKVPGAKFIFPEDVHDDGTTVIHMRHKTLAGVPNLSELTWVDWLPNGAHVGFSPISPTSGDDAVKQYEMVMKRCFEFGFDYIATYAVGLRELHHIVGISSLRYSALNY